MKNHTRWLFLILCSASSLAMAQWQWQDKDGRMVFSDRAPPGNVPDTAIVKRPGAPRQLPAVSGADASAAGTAAVSLPAAKTSHAFGGNKELLDKKKKTEVEQAATAKADKQHLQ